MYNIIIIISVYIIFLFVILFYSRIVTKLFVCESMRKKKKKKQKQKIPRTRNNKKEETILKLKYCRRFKKKKCVYMCVSYIAIYMYAF